MKQPKEKAGFWAEVAALNRAVKANIEAGRGRQSLIEAVHQQTIQKQGVRQAVTKSSVTPELQAFIDSTPQGERTTLTRQQYRQMMGLKD